MREPAIRRRSGTRFRRLANHGELACREGEELRGIRPMSIEWDDLDIYFKDKGGPTARPGTGIKSRLTAPLAS
jgi:hypothetical protein